MSEGKSLKRGTIHCPKHKQTALYFEQVSGMRMIRDGLLHARCPLCRADYTVEPNERIKK